MKKTFLGVVILSIFGLAGCYSGMEELPPLPTLAVVSDVPAEPDITAIPDMQEMSGITAVPTPTSKVTVSPKESATPNPTATPEPTLPPSPTPVSRRVSPEIQELYERAEKHYNTIIEGTLRETEEEINEFVREMSLVYCSFAVIVEEISELHTAEEYMELYPEIEKMTIEKLDIYRNGICVVFSEVESVYDGNLCYAIRTGDKSVLTDTEKELYRYLNEVLDCTGARTRSKVDTVKLLHDYLVLELKYDKSYQMISHSPEGVMRNKTAVCDGYARTMRLLLLLSGIDCKIVCGTAGEESHAWNLVKLEDGWYHVDVTWDDPVPDIEGKIGYQYFLKNDREMEKTHRWECEISCTGEAYQGYAYREVFCDSYDKMCGVFEKQIQTKDYLLFCYPRECELTQDVILEFVKQEVRGGVTYYPEREEGPYVILEIVNPLLESRTE